MSNFVERMIRRWIAARWILLAVAVALAVVAWPAARKLSMRRDIETMFAPDNPLLPPFHQLEELYGGNEIVMAVYRDAKLFDPDGAGLDRVASLAARIREVKGVRDTLSIDQPIGRLIIEPGSAVAVKMRDLFEAYTHGPDGETVCVVCMLHSVERTRVRHPDYDRGRDTIDPLRAIMAEMPGGMVTGEPAMVVDGFRYVERDGWLLGWATSLLLSVTVLLCFWSLRWVAIPLVVVHLALLLTRAVLRWSHFELTMVSSMLTSIVTVIGMATVVHLIVRFREGRGEGLSPTDALARAGALLAVPVFWACTTDAVGFAALLTSSVEPVRDFGVMMALGALMVIPAVVLATPALVLAGRWNAGPQPVLGKQGLGSALAGLLAWPRRHWLVFVLGVAVLTAVSVNGLRHLELESDFTRNFRRRTPIVQSYEYVETHLGGAGVWDIILPAPEELKWSYLRHVRDLEVRLREEVTITDEDGKRVPGLTKVISIADAVLAAAPPGFDPDNMTGRFQGRLRDTGVAAAQFRMRSAIPTFMDALHAPDPHDPDRWWLRIMLRANERLGTEQKESIIRQARAICHEALPPNDGTPGAEVTGFYVLLSNLVASLIADQWKTLAVAAAGIAVMMLLAFRHPVLAVVALVPNVLPVVVVMGLMGQAGIRINMGAAMIMAVSLGLSIDSSIHYITAVQRARRAGATLSEALDSVQQTVGRAVVFSTLALIVGFSILCISQFVPTVYFGALVSLSMLGGLAGNLMILPALLQWCLPEAPHDTE